MSHQSAGRCSRAKNAYDEDGPADGELPEELVAARARRAEFFALIFR